MELEDVGPLLKSLDEIFTDYNREVSATVLKNYFWLKENREAVLDMDTDTVVLDDGGYELGVLAEEGFTPATGRSSFPDRVNRYRK